MTRIMMRRPTNSITRVGRIAFTSWNRRILVKCSKLNMLTLQVMPMYQGSLTSSWAEPWLLIELRD